MNDIDVYGIIYFFDAGTTVALEYMDTFWAGSDTQGLFDILATPQPTHPTPQPSLALPPGRTTGATWLFSTYREMSGISGNEWDIQSPAFTKRP
jgi:hypothetical protein